MRKLTIWQPWGTKVGICQDGSMKYMGAYGEEDKTEMRKNN